jgi:hypothetical protein
MTEADAKADYHRLSEMDRVIRNISESTPWRISQNSSRLMARTERASSNLKFW